MDVLEYLIEDGLIMIPTLYFLGFSIKNTNLLPNWAIPFVLLTISLFITPWVLGGFTADNVVQSILVTAAAVLTNELFTQGKKGVDNNG